VSAKVVYEAATGRIAYCTDAQVVLEAGQAVLAVPEMVQPDAWRVDVAAKRLVPAPPIVIPPAVERAKRLREIDLTADTKRRQLGSPGDMQAVVYLLKADEARRFLADPTPDPASYPFLAAEVGITAPSMSAVAEQILAASNEWRAHLAQLDAARLAAKRDAEAEA
jgi:hypothetical protein